MASTGAWGPGVGGQAAQTSLPGRRAPYKGHVGAAVKFNTVTPVPPAVMTSCRHHHKYMRPIT